MFRLSFEARYREFSLFWLAILIWITCLAFLPLWSAGYVDWDDPVLVFQNAWMNLPFTDAISTFLSCPIEGDYIPLPLLSYWFEIHLAGLNPLVHHVTNLILHLLNISLLFFWIKEIQVPWKVSFFILIVFALHPMQVEPVLWISDRKSLLNGFFVLVSLLCFQKRLIGAYTVAYALSNFSKTTAILLPLVLLVTSTSVGHPHGKGLRQQLWIQAPALLVMCVFSLVRYFVMEEHLGFLTESFFELDRLAGLPVLILSAIGHYLVKFFWPARLMVVYPEFGFHTLWASELLSGLIFGAFFVKLVFFTKMKLQSQTLSRFFMIWFLFFLLPVLGIIPRGNFVNDRYMYLPVIGLAGVLGLLVLQISPRLPSFLHSGSRAGVSRAVLAAVLVCALTRWTYLQSKTWKNGMSLWGHVTDLVQTSRIAWNNLSVEQHHAGLYKESLESANRGILEGEDLVVPISILYRNRGDLFADPASPETYNRQAAQEDYQSALKTATRAVDMERARNALQRLQASPKGVSFY